MSQEIKCPECGSYNIEEIPYKAEATPGIDHEKHPEEADRKKYECIDCGLIFLESNLRE
jgi:DNA-directed RNA polymerase subunit RPC12/RpoP